MISFTGFKTDITLGAVLFKSSRTQNSNNETSIKFVRFAIPMVLAKFRMEAGV